jgi:uncharacterized protein YkwD
LLALRFRGLATGLLAAGCTCLSTPILSHAAHARLHTHSSAAGAVLRIINRDRKADGLLPLHLDPALGRAAMSHSLDMAEHGYFAHVAPDGSSPFQRIVAAGERYNVAGENLGMQRGTQRRAMFAAIEVAMLNSPEHRANLLRTTFNRVGIGVVTIGQTLFLTEDFAG